MYTIDYSYIGSNAWLYSVFGIRAANAQICNVLTSCGIFYGPRTSNHQILTRSALKVCT